LLPFIPAGENSAKAVPAMLAGIENFAARSGVFLAIGGIILPCINDEEFTVLGPDENKASIGPRFPGLARRL
jgi:hypothetical protein